MKVRSILLYPMVLVLFEIVAYLSNDMFLPALPSIMQDLSLSYSQTQLILTFWFLGSVSIQLILAPITERYGRKSVLVFGVAAFFLSTVVCALATTADSLFIARFVQGSSVCFVFVAGYAVIHESFNQKEAIRILALMSSVTVLAPAFGPLLGGIIVTIVNWRWIFGLLSVGGLIALVLVMKYMPTSVVEKQPFSLTHLVKQYGAIVANSQFMLTMVVYCSLFCGLIVWLAAGPFLIIDHFQLSPTMFGVAQAFIFGCFIIGSRLVRSSIEKIGVQKLIRAGLGLAITSCFTALVFSYLLPESLTSLVVCLMGYGLGCGIAFSPLSRSAIEACEEPMGIRMGILSTCISAFCALGSLLVTYFYHDSIFSLAAILVGLMLCAGLCQIIRIVKPSCILSSCNK